MQPSVYLDHAATTPVRPEVREAMLPYLGEAFGNPSSPHRYGRAARAGLEQARREVAEAIGAEPGQVVFTSGGTEADNLAVLGTALAARDRGDPMLAVAASTEHKAVLASLHAVRHLGGDERILPVGANGLLDLDALTMVLAERPAVVSVMWVNNETGVIQPVELIAARCTEAGVAFHTDAVQAFGKVPVSMRQVPGVMITLSGHKIGAPKGIGALVLGRRGLVDPIIHGGGQQSGIRPGTENVAGAIGLGRAAQLAAAELVAERSRLSALRERLAGAIARTLPDAVLNGAGAPMAPHVLSVSVPATDGEALLMHLDLAGVAASSGSACTTGSVEPSHVLTAMGLPRALALGTVRFSLGHASRTEDVDQAAAVLPGVVEKVRRLAAVLGRA